MSATVRTVPPAPEGTCVQISEAPEVWAVRGAADWYRLDLERNTCSCGDWMYRRARTLTPCKHQRALGAYLDQAALVRNRFEREQTAAEERAPLPGEAELKRMFA